MTARIFLSGPTTFYVSPSGLDTNTGLTALSPWLTFQHAINTLVAIYDFAGYTATISGADTAGSPYAGFIISQSFTGGGNLQIEGNTTTPTNCVISEPTANGAIISTNGVQFSIRGFQIKATVGNGIFAQLNSTIVINGKMDFGACGGDQIHSETHGQVYLSMGSAGYTISGGGTAHYGVALGGGIICSETTTPVTLSGTPVYSVAFVHATQCGVLYTNATSGYGPTFTGAASAGTRRYYISALGVVETETVSDPYFPGGTAGLTEQNGCYSFT